VRDNLQPRVYLAALGESDVEPLFEWINNEELVLYNSYFKPVSYEAHLAWFNRVTGDESTRIFGIRLRESDRLIGSCQLHSIHPVYKLAELQIRLGDLGLTSKGLGSEAVSLLLKYGFEELRLNRIFLTVFATNLRAIRAYEKNGFVHEGRMRQAAFLKGQYVDVLIMSILREEYYSKAESNPRPASD
jgi:RimJ/RimL family protein N-acetyltransferase